MYCILKKNIRLNSQLKQQLDEAMNGQQASDKLIGELRNKLQDMKESLRACQVELERCQQSLKSCKEESAEHTRICQIELGKCKEESAKKDKDITELKRLV